MPARLAVSARSVRVKPNVADVIPATPLVRLSLISRLNSRASSACAAASVNPAFTMAVVCGARTALILAFTSPAVSVNPSTAT